jgi:hypothetical protein
MADLGDVILFAVLPQVAALVPVAADALVAPAAANHKTCVLLARVNVRIMASNPLLGTSGMSHVTYLITISVKLPMMKADRATDRNIKNVAQMVSETFRAAQHMMANECTICCIAKSKQDLPLLSSLSQCEG